MVIRRVDPTDPDDLELLAKDVASFGILDLDARGVVARIIREHARTLRFEWRLRKIEGGLKALSKEVAGLREALSEPSHR